MEVREAAQKAKQYVSYLYEGEKIANVGLEEVEFDELSNAWEITVGFSRPWERRKSVNPLVFGNEPNERSYKVVRIDDENGEITSLTDRFLEAKHR